MIVEATQAAKAAGAVVSFDLNYRAKLWNISGGEERAVAVLDRIVRNVDVLVGNEEDLQKGLGIPGQDVTAKSKLDPSAFFGMIGQVVKKHPQVKVVATTLREVHSTNRHSWSAVAWIDGQTYSAPTAELDVLRPRGRRRRFRFGLLLRPADGSIARRRPCGWAGRTARCSPRFPETPPWRRWIRCARSPRAARRGSSARAGAATVRERLVSRYWQVHNVPVPRRAADRLPLESCPMAALVYTGVLFPL